MQSTKDIIVIAHDIRSCHNVGSLLRTAEGFGVRKVFLTGYTPYPEAPNDDRMPHITQKLTRDIHKTALGAEELIPWSHHKSALAVIHRLHDKGYTITALEQAKTSISLPDFHPPDKLALLLGREVEGIDDELLQHCDVTLEIPMFGKKESFNVVQAAAVAIYHCRFF